MATAGGLSIVTFILSCSWRDWARLELAISTSKDMRSRSSLSLPEASRRSRALNSAVLASFLEVSALARNSAMRSS
eukprot:841512-Heterocapsa_arctica.AAC.1